MTQLLNYYDLSLYEWALTLKGQNQIYGFFVSFTVNYPDNIKDNYHYPLVEGKRFAFCPKIFFKEYESLPRPLHSKPNNIIFFDENEIQSLQLSISH